MLEKRPNGHPVGHTFLAALTLISFVSLIRPCPAQCSFDWLPGDPVPGVAGSAGSSVLWDPDGTGPAPEMLVVGGGFSAA